MIFLPIIFAIAGGLLVLILGHAVKSGVALANGDAAPVFGYALKALLVFTALEIIGVYFGITSKEFGWGYVTNPAFLFIVAGQLISLFVVLWFWKKQRKQ